MKFYTYIGLLKNKIFVREIDENDEHSFSDNFQPTMYTTAPSEKCNYTTLDGIPVGHIKFDNIASCKDFIKQYSGTTNYPILAILIILYNIFLKSIQRKFNGIRISYKYIP